MDLRQSNAEASNFIGYSRMNGGATACDLLRELMDAHGGHGRFSRFKSARANFRINGEIWSGHDGRQSSAEGRFELRLHDQDVRLYYRSPRAMTSTFAPNVVAIESVGGGFVETQYNPRSSFPTSDAGRPWDDFQLAYVCSYSIWNVVTQPFLFSNSGFESTELTSFAKDGEVMRRVEVSYPSHIASHAAKIVCHVGADGTMRRQEFNFDLLNASVTSVLSDYGDVQGLRLPMRRCMYRTENLCDTKIKPLAVVEIDSLTFY